MSVIAAARNAALRSDSPLAFLAGRGRPAVVSGRAGMVVGPSGGGGLGESRSRAGAGSRGSGSGEVAPERASLGVQLASGLLLGGRNRGVVSGRSSSGRVGGPRGTSGRSAILGGRAGHVCLQFFF